MLASGESVTGADITSLLPSRRGDTGSVSTYATEPYMEAKRKAVADFTATYLRTKLAMHDGHITKAAEESGIPRQHFSLLMKRYLGHDGKP
jgi:DNA-binding NtrC family response regulator